MMARIVDKYRWYGLAATSPQAQAGETKPDALIEALEQAVSDRLANCSKGPELEAARQRLREALGIAQGSDGAACGDSSQASQRLSGDLQPAPSEADYLENNIATVAFHLGQPGVRLRVFRPGDGPGLIVDPGEVLQEISRRLSAAQGAANRGKTWTRAEYWQYVESLAGEFERDQMRDTLAERGLEIVPSPPAALPAGEIIQQHISWLFQYVRCMNADNWRDMRDNADRQLEQLSEALSISSTEGK